MFSSRTSVGSTGAAPLTNGRLRPLSLFFAASATLAAASFCAEATAGVFGNSFLFATPEACASSGMFRRRQCDIAFANALAELQERTQSFASRSKCEARFRLCERRPGADEGYRPALLGIEIVIARDHPSATPVLAVETPRMFAGRSISQLVAPARQEADRWIPILPGDRFRPDGANVFESRDMSFAPHIFAPHVFAPHVEDSSAATFDEAVRPERESASARRERLRSAPFIE